MIPDGLQYLLDDFWNFEHVDQIWTRRHPNYYQNASNNIRKYGNIFNTSYFRIWESKNLKTLTMLKVMYTFSCNVIYFLIVLFYITFYEDEDREMITFA